MEVSYDDIVFVVQRDTARRVELAFTRSLGAEGSYSLSARRQDVDAAVLGAGDDYLALAVDGDAVWIFDYGDDVDWSSQFLDGPFWIDGKWKWFCGGDLLGC